MAVNHWLRPGNTAAGTNYLAFLEDTLSRLEDKKAGLVRMDSGSFTKEILDFPEYKKMRYIVACRFNNRIKNSLTHEKVWVEVADGLETSETSYQTEGWDRPRRINRYSCLVTNLRLPAKMVYDSYRGRADSGNRIKELKYDFSIDDFVTDNFWATEACGSFIVMAYNFMSLFRHALINSDKKQFLKTIRYELNSTPAYLDRIKDRHILYLARALKKQGKLSFLFGRK